MVFQSAASFADNLNASIKSDTLERTEDLGITERGTSHRRQREMIFGDKNFSLAVAAG